MTTEAGVGRLVRAFRGRRNARRLWGAVGTGLLVPPLRAFGAFGQGSLLLPPTRVQSPEHIYIGSRVELQEHEWLCVVPRPGLPPPRLVIGDGTRMLRFVKIVCTGAVTIGDDNIISDHAFITDTQYAHDDPDAPLTEHGLGPSQPVVLGRRVFVGHRAIIGPGVTIGDNAYVGAGAVVREDVPARTVVAGHPARVVRRYDDASRTWKSVGDA